MEANLSKQKEYCPHCGHIIAKERVNLSSLEFRRLIHSITDLEELISKKDYIYRHIKSSYKVQDFANQFLEDLEDKIEVKTGNDDLDNIKLWLLGFINNLDRSFPLKELYLYEFLCLDGCPAIDMPFSEFYDNYCHWVSDPMSKNRVSRSLLAFGLKTVMKKIMCDGKMKSTIMLCATKDELLELCEKNGLRALC
jgi:hypothetical protein